MKPIFIIEIKARVVQVQEFEVFVLQLNRCFDIDLFHLQRAFLTTVKFSVY